MIAYPTLRILSFLAAATITVAIPNAFCQTATEPAKPLAFEVATIKPNKTDNGRWRLQPTPDGYTGMGISLRQLVQEAYGIYDDKLLSGGPPWIESEKFDIEAKFDVSEIAEAQKLTYAQRAAMLRPLLADRFKLKVHRETKEFPAFFLVLAKGGSKLQETKSTSLNDSRIGVTCHFRHSRTGYIDVQGCSMTNLADTLRDSVCRTVLDKTGLIGRYDFELRWTPDSTPALDSSDLSIFTAVQEQLGLKLKPTTAPLDALVIDDADMPSEN